MLYKNRYLFWSVLMAVFPCSVFKFKNLKDHNNLLTNSTKLIMMIILGISFKTSNLELTDSITECQVHKGRNI